MEHSHTLMESSKPTDELPVRPYEDIRVEIVGPVGVVTIDRPPRNTTRPRTLPEIHRAIADLDRIRKVRVIVLTGTDRHFISGADLKEGTLLDAQAVDRERAGATQALELHEWNSLLKCSKVVIAAVEGDAVGVGASLVTKCDLRVASSTTRFGWVFTRRGLIPEVGSHWLLPRLVGQAIAADLLLTGRLVGAEEAQRIGFVSRIAEPGTVLDVAMGIAEQIASDCSPLSVQLTKRLLWAALDDSSYARSNRAEGDAFRWIVENGDAREGVAAFVDKRKPEWTAHERVSPPPFVPMIGDPGPFFTS